MVFLRWKDEFSVGIEAVDHEHKELIDLINRLHEQLSTRGYRTVMIDTYPPGFKGAFVGTDAGVLNLF